MPYATGFDHLRLADEVHFKFERCLKALGPAAIRLQRFGVGHSLGALLHALIGSRYPIASAGNVLMSYNNRPATGVWMPCWGCLVWVPWECPHRCCPTCSAGG